MNEKIYTDFEDYINDEMSVDEKINFENQLQKDASLSESFKLYKETTLFAAQKFSAERTDFQNNLNKISDGQNIKIHSQKSKVISLRTALLAIAAVFVLFFSLQLFQNNTPEYLQYNQHDKAAFVERGNIIESLKLAQDAYNAKKYKEAIEHFEVVLKEYPRPAVQYFYAISLLEDNRFLDSELVLNKLIKGQSTYKNTASWYLALSKLKQKDYKACKTVLLTIPEDYEDYDRVRELLKKLE